MLLVQRPPLSRVADAEVSMARSETDGPARRGPVTVAGLLRTWRALEALIEALASDDSRLSIVCEQACEVRQVYQALTAPGAGADVYFLARAVTNRADAMLHLFLGPEIAALGRSGQVRATQAGGGLPR